MVVLLLFAAALDAYWRREKDEAMERPAQNVVPSPDAEATVPVIRYDYDDMRITAGVLRWMMILLPALLFVVTLHHAATTGSFEGSISAYYGGPARDVFVGVIIATAVCMVAYRGWFALEDFALNAAGFFAVFVALVPAGLDAIMADLRNWEETLAELKAGGALTEEQVAALAEAKLPFTAAEYGVSLRVALLAAAVLIAIVVVGEWKQSDRTRLLFKRGGWSRITVIGTAVVAACFVIMAYYQLLVGPEDQVSLPGIAVGPIHLDVHSIAAILMIASLLVAVASHAWPARAARADPRRSLHPADKVLRGYYRIIFILMSLGAVAVVVFSRIFFPAHVVILLEWWEILLFCLFWGLETVRVNRYRRQAGRLNPHLV